MAPNRGQSDMLLASNVKKKINEQHSQMYVTDYDAHLQVDLDVFGFLPVKQTNN